MPTSALKRWPPTVDANGVMNSLPNIVGATVTEERIEPSALLLAAAGELDIATAEKLREPLTTALDAGIRRLVIDLSEVSFMDSVALAALVQASRRLDPDGRMAIVIAPGSYTRLIFEAAGLDGCLDLVATREQAVAHVTG
jgi:anti-anti-sigma factor